ncbi:hypothetical protein [Actinomadura madurae]|uniref:hypothetical protein n=1 Tax=Actinomadura madurae TaxID=1993 RepID=UPI0020D209E5|nr:hypothetical protein [Actinomadura madurae]MCQ0016707.1 hypothetical protein [Actinomadura madurae]
MVITAPVAGVLERLATHDDRARRQQLAEHLPARPRRVEMGRVGDRLAEPLVQPDAADPEPVARPSSGPAMNPSSDIDMYNTDFAILFRPFRHREAHRGRLSPFEH